MTRSVRAHCCTLQKLACVRYHVREFSRYYLPVSKFPNVVLFTT